MPNMLRAEREGLLHRDERHLMRDVIRVHQVYAPPDEGGGSPVGAHGGVPNTPSAPLSCEHTRTVRARSLGLAVGEATTGASSGESTSSVSIS
jgi:hypothetical protein